MGTKHMTCTAKTKDLIAVGLCLLLVLCVAFLVAGVTQTDFLSHSASDSYTLQALAWREGQVLLPQDYPWLELAIYEGNYYVSFPPVPTVPMWLLSFVFGEQTPNSLMTLLYFLGSCAAAFYLARRYMGRLHAAVLTVFMALGGSLLDITVSGRGFSGSVWYQAQLLGFLLLMLSFLAMDSRQRGWHAASLVFIALAVGCRPTNGVYVPFLLYWLYWITANQEADGQVANSVPRLHGRTQIFFKTLRAMLPYLIVPALIACVYGWYNWVRFDNPLEFGHTYLPEFTRSGDAFFDLSRIGPNLRNILRLPELFNGNLVFVIVGGFAVYLTNPMFVYGFGRMAENMVAKKVHILDALLFAFILLHAVSLLMHRTNGGWQYGTRYLTDVVPALLYLFVRSKKPIRLIEAVPMGALILFNVYGGVVFQYLSGLRV